MKNQQENFKVMEEDDQIYRATRAFKNWEKVRDIVKNKNVKKNQQFYHLFPIEHQHLDKIVKSVNLIDQFTIFTNAPNPNFQYLITQQSDEIDTTGTWVWEAQNLLTYFLYKNEEYGKVQTVLELGAGTSGLASLLFCMKYKPQKVVITDGKQQNIQFLQMNILDNSLSETIRTQKYLWGSQQITQKFELILASDCLFFEKYHDELIKTFDDNLQKNGTILLVNPKRGKSMSNFLLKLKSCNYEYDIIDFPDPKFKENYSKALKSSNFTRDKDIYFFLQVRKVKALEKSQNSEKTDEKQ